MTDTQAPATVERRQGKQPKEVTPPKNGFTKDWLSTLHSRMKKQPVAGDYVIFDKALPRFGVRIKGQSISFLIQYRTKLKGGGIAPSKRYGIGKYLQPWSLDGARERARLLLTEADCGNDPLQARIEAEKAPTVRQLVAEYRGKLEAGKPVRADGKLHKPGTIRSERWRLDHIADFFGDQKARDVTARDILRFRDQLMDEKKGPARTLGTMSALMSYGNRYHDGITAGLQGVKAPADRQRQVHLSPSQYALLGAAIRDAEAAGGVSWQVGPAIYLLALTGCRRSEILELKWSEVDLEGGALRFADSKTGQSVRPLPEAAARILRHIRENHSRHSDYVLPGKPGSGRHFTALTLPWTRVLPTELKKLPPDNEDLSPHGLRHAYASLAHDMGCGEIVIANILGHSKGKGTTRGYIHGVDAIAKREANRVADAIAAYLDGNLNVIPLKREAN